MNPYELANAASDELRSRSGVDSYDVGVVLGTGWKEGADQLGEAESRVSVTELPGFVRPTVAGHDGEILSLKFSGLNVALASGRVHLYEGNDAHQVAHCVRTLVLAGAKKIILTNACGGLVSTSRVGSVVLIKDHINLMGTSPMEGVAPPEEFGSRFVDLGDLYSARLRGVVKASAPELSEGVYAGFRGPNYETMAEIEMVVRAGATLVGMSTVLEAVAGKHLGAEILGLSLVTDLVGGSHETTISHLEVLAAADGAKEYLGTLLGRVIPVL